MIIKSLFAIPVLQVELDLDLDKLLKYSLDTWLFKQGEMVSLVIHLGHRLGLYEAIVRS